MIHRVSSKSTSLLIFIHAFNVILFFIILSFLHSPLLSFFFPCLLSAFPISFSIFHLLPTFFHFFGVYFILCSSSIHQIQWYSSWRYWLFSHRYIISLHSSFPFHPGVRSCIRLWRTPWPLWWRLRRICWRTYSTLRGSWTPSRRDSMTTWRRRDCSSPGGFICIILWCPSLRGTFN